MKNWYNHVCVEKNIGHIEKWLKYYNIEKYKETQLDGIVGLSITHKNKTYNIAIECDNERLRVICKNQVGVKKEKEKVHILTRVGDNGYIYGDNCWVSLIKEIVDKV